MLSQISACPKRQTGGGWGGDGGRKSRRVTWERSRIWREEGTLGRGSVERKGGACGADSIPDKGGSFLSCGKGWGCDEQRGWRAGPGESCGGRTGGSVWGCPGPGSGPSQSSAQAPEAKARGKGPRSPSPSSVYRASRPVRTLPGSCGPAPAPALLGRTRPARRLFATACALRPGRAMSVFQLARTLTNLPDNQAPPPPIGRWKQAASFFSHWKGRVQTARVRLPELAEVGGPALKGVELSVRGGGQGKPGLCTECRTSASGVRCLRPFFAARSALKWLSLFPHCDSAQSELKERSLKMKGTFLHQGNVTLIAYVKL